MDQLQKALAISKKTKESVEHVLIRNFEIDRESVGKSLSNCYGYPFRSYDPELSTPVELLKNLKKTFLLQNRWVPLGWDSDGIEVLLDDPIDLNKVDILRALLQTRKIKKMTVCLTYFRSRLVCSRGRINNIAAPVVPMKLAMPAPTARKMVLVRGWAGRSPLS